MGPLPGLVVGCVLYAIDSQTTLPVLRGWAYWLVWLNFLNLLPFRPLDGGKLLDRLVFIRTRALDAAAVVLATVGMVFLCLRPGWVCLAISGLYAVLVLAPSRYKAAAAADELRTRQPNLPADLEGLDNDQWRDRFRCTQSRFPQKQLHNPLKFVHKRAALKPASSRTTAAFLTIYVFAMLLTLVTVWNTNLSQDVRAWYWRFEQTKDSP